MEDTTTTTTEEQTTTTTTTESAPETTSTTTVAKQGEVAVDKGAEAETLEHTPTSESVEEAKREGLRNGAADAAAIDEK